MTEKLKHSRFFMWCIQVLRVCGRELLLVFRDQGVVIFFLLLNALYPVLYALIYNPEVVRNEAVVVVDDNRTAMSRELVRRMDATQEIHIVGYAANMQEAQDAMHRKACYGILHVPRDFGQSVARGEQGHVSLYCDMSVMMRYKAMFTALTNVTQGMGNEHLAATVEPVLNMSGSIIESRQVPVGNPAMGIASAVLLFILPLVLQQSMILGIAMLHGGSIERRRRNGGRDPMAIEAGVSATIIGKMMCHQIVFVIPVICVVLCAVDVRLPAVWQLPACRLSGSAVCYRRLADGTDAASLCQRARERVPAVCLFIGDICLSHGSLLAALPDVAPVVCRGRLCPRHVDE